MNVIMLLKLNETNGLHLKILCVAWITNNISAHTVLKDTVAPFEQSVLVTCRQGLIELTYC